MGDGFVGVKAIYMKKIDATIGELRNRVIE
jgi:hypothetical protein